MLKDITSCLGRLILSAPFRLVFVGFQRLYEAYTIETIRNAPFRLVFIGFQRLYEAYTIETILNAPFRLGFVGFERVMKHTLLKLKRCTKIFDVTHIPINFQNF